MYGPIIISIDGYHISSEEQAKILQHPLVGGVVLYADNYQNKAQLVELTSEIHTIGLAADKDLIIMVDHEGGYVQRFRKEFTAVPAAKVIGEIYDLSPETALHYAHFLGEKVGQELVSVGIDVVLGPVVDLDTGNTVISGFDRAFHENPQVVTDIASAYIQGMNETGAHCTLKHFPGHGAKDIGDSHFVEPVDSRSFEELSTQDLLPFQNLIEQDLNVAIMPAHVTYPQVDANHTAGASQIWLEDILRDSFGFEGVIISDCLSMAGAGEGSNVEKTLQALEYGDLAILSHQTPEEYLALLDDLEAAQFTWSQESQQRVENWLHAHHAEIGIA